MWVCVGLFFGYEQLTWTDSAVEASRVKGRADWQVGVDVNLIIKSIEI